LSLVRDAVLTHCTGLVGDGGAIDAASITARLVGLGLGFLSSVVAATFAVLPAAATAAADAAAAAAAAAPVDAVGGEARPPTHHTVIVKVAPSRADAPPMLDLRFHATEVAFYSQLRSLLTTDVVPAIYGGAVDDATDAGVVVMEDLTPRGGRVLPFAYGLPVGAALAAATALGRLHADIDAALRDGGNDSRGGRPPAWVCRPPAVAARRAATVAGLFDDASARLAAAGGAGGVRLDAADWVPSPTAPQRPPAFATVVNGDCWSNNLFFRHGGAAADGGGADTWAVVGIVDWQVASWDAGAADIAFLWLSSVDPAVPRRPGATAAYLDAYARGLGSVGSGVGRPGLVADWNDALPWALVMCMTMLEVFERACLARLEAAVEDAVAARRGEGPLVLTP